MKQLNQFVVMAGCLAAPLLSVAAAEAPVLPWQREISLREAAKSVTIDGTLNATQPGGRGGAGVTLNNLKMHTVMWGPPNRITISITKNNVWDRRLHEFQAPTLQEITEGAFSPANKDYIGVKEIDSVTFDLPDIVELRPSGGQTGQQGGSVIRFRGGPSGRRIKGVAGGI